MLSSRVAFAALGLAAILAAALTPAPAAAQSPPSKGLESERGAPGLPSPGPGATDEKSAPNKGAPKSATPGQGAPGDLKANPKGNPQAKGKAAPKGPPPIAVQKPRTPAEREKALNDLYALLATADDETKAKSLAASIERMWLNSGSDTIAALMDRAMHAQQGKNPTLALKLLDAIVDLAPDYAEGWSRRAYVHFAENNVERALGDLRRVLALDANHFKALDGMAHILKDIGQKKAALGAVRKLLEVHPYWDGAKTMQDELARDVEGQAL